jgi:hypothetical protein
MDRWLLVLPRYGKLWAMLYEGEGSTHTLQRRLHVTAEELFAMLAYLQSLGALDAVEVHGETRITLHRLPPVFDFDPGRADVSPWHRNQRADVEAFEALRAWALAYQAVAGRPYSMKRTTAELRMARDMLGKYMVPIGDLIDVMAPFLDEAKALGDLSRFSPFRTKSEATVTGLKLLRYLKYRRHGPTFSTFCALYADVAEQVSPTPKGKVPGMMSANDIRAVRGSPSNLKHARSVKWRNNASRAKRAITEALAGR